MKLGYLITYVGDVSATVDFYEKAFGLKRHFLHESLAYAEMETGATKIAFASFEMGTMNGVASGLFKKPTETLPFEIAFVTEDVEGAFVRAVKEGAVEIQKPKQKPWGQLVGYVKDCNGFLIEICSPMN